MSETVLKLDHLTDEERQSFQRLYNMSQILAMKCMMLIGTIKNPIEYCQRGVAKVFEMMIAGDLSIPDIDWHDIRKQVDDLLGVNFDSKLREAG